MVSQEGWRGGIGRIRVDVVLHIGPHKTGTTSLQRFLGDRFGRVTPRRGSTFWYPDPGPAGPGHAAIAKALLAHDATPLTSALSKGRRAGVGTILFSSELFCHAYNDKLKLLGNALRGHEVILLVTLNSPIRRATSSWQELLKHGLTKCLQESVQTIIEDPGYKTDLISAFVRSISPKKTRVIILEGPSKPSCLFEYASKAIGFELQEPVALTANRGLGRIEAEMLLAMNRTIRQNIGSVDGPSYTRLRDTFLKYTRSEEWRALFPYIPIELPDSAKEQFAALSLMTFDAVSNMRDIDIYGDPRHLLA